MARTPPYARSREQALRAPTGGFRPVAHKFDNGIVGIGWGIEELPSRTPLDEVLEAQLDQRSSVTGGARVLSRSDSTSADIPARATSFAAGINAKTLSTFLGHASITTTLDRYGHLFPGSEAEAAGMLDAYLDRASTQSRIRQLDLTVD